MGVRVCFGKTLVTSNTRVTTNICTWRDGIHESCPCPYSRVTVPVSYPAAGLYTRLTTKLTFSTHHKPSLLALPHVMVSAFPRCTKRDGEFELWTVAQGWLRACAPLRVLTPAGSGAKMCQIPALQLFAAALTRYNTTSSTGGLCILQTCFCLGVLENWTPGFTP